MTFKKYIFPLTVWNSSIYFLYIELFFVLCLLKKIAPKRVALQFRCVLYNDNKGYSILLYFNCARFNWFCKRWRHISNLTFIHFYCRDTHLNHPSVHVSKTCRESTNMKARVTVNLLFSVRHVMRLHSDCKQFSEILLK